MKHFNRFTLLFVSLLGFTAAATAQQDPTFTRYLFNPLVYNPATAGRKEYLILTALHRQQFIGLEGGPNTQIISGDLPVGKGKRVGLGLTISNDQIGPTNQNNIDFSYAYRIKVGEGKLAFGLSAGLLNWRSDWSKLLAYDGIDPTYSTNMSINVFRPKFGAGLYYQHPAFYVGLGVPHLLDFDVVTKGVGNEYFGRQYRHYLLTAGTQFYFNTDLQFRPNIVLRSIGLFENNVNSTKSPSSVDIDASLLFYEKFQVGAAYRFALDNTPSSPQFNSDSFSTWLSYHINTNIKVGASYDFPLTKIGQFSSGAYQLMVSYEFFNEVTDVENPMPR
jgi:type IX secretion system PorP/SprF family membrane protein